MRGIRDNPESDELGPPSGDEPQSRVSQDASRLKVRPSISRLMIKGLGTIGRSGRRFSALPWRTQMIGEGIDGPNKLNQAKEAVEAATQTVKETTRSVAGAIEGDRRPGAPLDRLARWAQEAPLHAVMIAFLVGVLLGRRRR